MIHTEENLVKTIYVNDISGDQAVIKITSSSDFTITISASVGEYEVEQVIDIPDVIAMMKMLNKFLDETYMMYGFPMITDSSKTENKP
jgi:hypothetical protein